MTTELERKFFETFEIEPKYKDYRTKNGKEYECKNPNNRNIRLCYPQITDRILLELICILCKRDYELGCCWFAISNNVEELKNYLLGDCIEYVSDIKHQVQELFKGE